jgi:hypothetical protein
LIRNARNLFPNSLSGQAVMEGRLVAVLVLSVCGLCAACRPHGPPIDFWTHDDLKYYRDLAAQVEASVELCDDSPDGGAVPPATLQNFHEQQPWDVSLQEAVHLALANSRVVRQLPPLQVPFQGGPAVPQPSDAVLRPMRLPRSTTPHSRRAAWRDRPWASRRP